jgi:hypothetical protein
MSELEPQKWMPTPQTDPMMRPRSPRPSHPNKDKRTRLRALNQITPISERRILNYFLFPNLADELHFYIEQGISLDTSDSDSDSDYELPPQRIHREGKQLPAFHIKWLKEGEQCAAKELVHLSAMPAYTDQEDWYGIMVLPKPESEPEDFGELDSPSRQLREELSQMSQSECARAEVEVDEDTREILEATQQILMPSHEEVMLWVTEDPVPTEIHSNGLSSDHSEVSGLCDTDAELERDLKRKRATQEKLLRRLNGVHEP